MEADVEQSATRLIIGNSAKILPQMPYSAKKFQEMPCDDNMHTCDEAKIIVKNPHTLESPFVAIHTCDQQKIKVKNPHTYHINLVLF